jgi:hypothetical protein
MPKQRKNLSKVDQIQVAQEDVIHELNMAMVAAKDEDFNEARIRMQRADRNMTYCEQLPKPSPSPKAKPNCHRFTGNSDDWPAINCLGCMNDRFGVCHR